MRVYYTGDMANQPGWFTATEAEGGQLVLREEDGPLSHHRSPWVVFRRDIGDVYHGHCDPRFVTEQAYRNYYASRKVGS